MTVARTPTSPLPPPRIVLFGGSFNPIHHGHLIVARSVIERLKVSCAVLIPSATPPHKQARKDLADSRQRLHMVQLAIENETDFEVDDVEIQREGPSYTYDTVQYFQKKWGSEACLYWIIGGDSLPELHTWHRSRELVDSCTMVTAVRPGYEAPDLAVLEPTLTAEQIQRLADHVLPTPRVDISATEIRRRVQAGLSIRYLVPERVREYIMEQGLYR